MSFYFERTPDDVLPQVLKDKNVFAPADDIQGRVIVDDYTTNKKILDNLEAKSLELDAKFNQLSITSSIGVIKKYLPQNKNLQKIVDLVDRLVPKSKVATEALQGMTKVNLVETQEAIEAFMEMGSTQFAQAGKSSLTNAQANGYRIADYFRALRSGSVGLTGTAFDEVLGEAWRFLAGPGNI